MIDDARRLEGLELGAPERTSQILVVDDEPQICRALRSILASRGYDVLLAADGERALETAIDRSPDMIILDLSLPGMDGLEVCKELRTWYTSPILVLSVRTADADKITLLDAGADDYLTKPFSAGELLARIRAQLRRRSYAVIQTPTIGIGDLEIDFARRLVKRADVDIDLTRTEFDILALLARNLGCVVTSKMLLEAVWGPEHENDTQTLRVHISHLRKKIEPYSPIPRYVLTEPGVGFRLASP